MLTYLFLTQSERVRKNGGLRIYIWGRKITRH